MSRLHVHLHVRDLEQSIAFYTTLFGAVPAREEKGHAKWMLEDPRVNFAISTGGSAGLSHLGIQVDDDAELRRASARAEAAAGSIVVEKDARCCYAAGNKAWASDPQGVQWETFHTLADLDEPGTGAAFVLVNGAPAALDAACACAPSPAAQRTACCA
jgi:catechol 2,3-dioxygenase-like lactoylglutathione lyase family enzyme